MYLHKVYFISGMVILMNNARGCQYIVKCSGGCSMTDKDTANTTSSFSSHDVLPFSYACLCPVRDIGWVVRCAQFVQ